jgi:hypothetical protein
LLGNQGGKISKAFHFIAERETNWQRLLPT